MSEDKEASEVVRLRSQVENLQAALFYTVTVLNAYDAEIRNSEEVIPGLDLVSFGFCQGAAFTAKYDRLSQIYRGARDYPEGFDYAARLEGFVMRDVKPEVGLFFVFGTSDEGVMEGGALDFLGAFQTAAEARRRLEFPAVFEGGEVRAGHVASFAAGAFEVVASGALGGQGSWEWHTDLTSGHAYYFAFGGVNAMSGGALDLLGVYRNERAARRRFEEQGKGETFVTVGHIAVFRPDRLTVMAAGRVDEGGAWEWLSTGAKPAEGAAADV